HLCPVADQPAADALEDFSSRGGEVINQIANRNSSGLINRKSIIRDSAVQKESGLINRFLRFAFFDLRSTISPLFALCISA
ncbi:MAG: hypothetical protein ACQERO_11350, partial [Bacteroidota bacterium]